MGEKNVFKQLLVNVMVLNNGLKVHAEFILGSLVARCRTENMCRHVTNRQPAWQGDASLPRRTHHVLKFKWAVCRRNISPPSDVVLLVRRCDFSGGFPQQTHWLLNTWVVRQTEELFPLVWVSFAQRSQLFKFKLTGCRRPSNFFFF